MDGNAPIVKPEGSIMMRSMVLSQEDMKEAIQDYCDKHLKAKRLVASVTTWDSSNPSMSYTTPKEFQVTFEGKE